MFDPLNSDFDITYILRHHNGSWEKVPVVAEAEQGVGMLLCCKMAVASKLQVKVGLTCLALLSNVTSGGYRIV